MSLPLLHKNNTVDPGETPIGNPWTHVFCAARHIDTRSGAFSVPIHVCSYGVEFLMIFLLSFVLMVVAVYSLIQLQRHCPKTHTHRKVLFAFLLLVAIMRGSYGLVGSIGFGKAKTARDAWKVIANGVHIVVPLSAVSDFATAAADFMMTFFWLSVLRSRVTRKRTVRVAASVLGAGFFVAMFVCIAVDYVHLQDDDTEWNVYRNLLGYVAVVLIVSAVLHTVTVFELLRQLRLDHLHVGPELKRQFTIVGTIGCVSAGMWSVRGIVCLGRALEWPFFTTGPMSFANAQFSLIYFAFLMNVPCIIVAFAFFFLSLRLFRTGGTGADGYTEITDDDTNISFRQGNLESVNSKSSRRIDRNSFKSDGRDAEASADLVA